MRSRDLKVGQIVSARYSPCLRLCKVLSFSENRWGEVEVRCEVVYSAARYYPGAVTYGLRDIEKFKLPKSEEFL